MKLYFVRHGESEANLLREFSNGLNKHGLTAKGRAQARALAETLKNKGIARIYTSPILRAAQTAEILSQTLGAPIETADALREYDVGILEGTKAEAGWELYWQVADAWLRRGQLNERIPGGESFLDIRARFLPFMERVTAQEQSGDLVLVGHGGTYRSMLPLALGNVTFAFAANTGIGNTAAILAETGPRGLFCLDWCGHVPPTAGDSLLDAPLVELILRFNDALNAQDVDGMMALMSADCVFENTAPFPDGTRYSGQAAVRAFWEEFFRASGQPRIDVEAIFAAGVHCTLRWVYSWNDANGERAHIRGVDVYHVADGLITEKLSYVKG